MNNYLRRLFELNKYISRLSNLMVTELKDIKKGEEYCLINKDIIKRYLDSDIYKKINEYNNNNPQIDIDTLLNKLIQEQSINTSYFDKLEKEENEIFKMFLTPEKLKIKYVEIPNNFFIIDRNLSKLFNESIETNDVFIGKEGIFIEKSIKVDSKDKFLVYFIKSMINFDINEFKINKVYIFDDKKQFYDELEHKIKGKTPEQYFASRNFYDKGGISNMVDDGKIIFMYINMNRIENYENEENGIDKNREYIENFYKRFKKE